MRVGQNNMYNILICSKLKQASAGMVGVTDICQYIEHQTTPMSGENKINLAEILWGRVTRNVREVVDEMLEIKERRQKSTVPPPNNDKFTVRPPAISPLRRNA